MFLVKLDAAGALSVAQGFGGGADDVGRDLAIDDAGVVVISGQTYPPGVDFGGGGLATTMGTVYVAAISP